MLSCGSRQTCTRCSTAFCAVFQSAPSSSGTPRKLSRPLGGSGWSKSILLRPGRLGYLLDGQQRVSTLVGTLLLPGAAGIDRGSSRLVRVLRPRQLEFIRAQAGGVEPQHFPVRSLLNTAGFFAACRRISSEVDDKVLALRWLNEADRLANAFRDYQLPLIHIRDADLDSAVTVFARLNRTGRKMTADEMVSALTYREGQFHLAKKLDEFKTSSPERGLGISIASSFSGRFWLPSTGISTRRTGQTSW